MWSKQGINALFEGLKLTTCMLPDIDVVDSKYCSLGLVLSWCPNLGLSPRFLHANVHASCKWVLATRNLVFCQVCAVLFNFAQQYLLYASKC